MTINKSQGQTIPNVGIYLFRTRVLARGVSRSTTRILAKPKEDLDPTGKSTKNIDVLNW
jgi:ATP-dependent DNA helicase PIF1